jgi:hypothetical protein
MQFCPRPQTVSANQAPPVRDHGCNAKGVQPVPIRQVKKGNDRRGHERRHIIEKN